MTPRGERTVDRFHGPYPPGCVHNCTYPTTYYRCRASKFRSTQELSSLHRTRLNSGRGLRPGWRVRPRFCDVALGGSGAWANHRGASRQRQILERTKMSAKKSVHGKEKFLSATWSGSQARRFATSIFPSLPAPIRAPQGAGFARATALRRPCTRSRSTFSRAFDFEITTTALSKRIAASTADGRRAARASSAGVDTLVMFEPALEGRGPVEDWTDGCLAVRAVIYRSMGGSLIPCVNSGASDVLKSGTRAHGARQLAGVRG